MNRSKKVHRKGFPEINGVFEEIFCRDSGCSRESCSCGFFHDDGVSGLADKLGDGGYVEPEEVAFIAIEPVQGEGGYYVPSDSFMDEIGWICRSNGIPLIVDEIQSGLGRTGEMWASDHFSIEPDVIASAKAGRVGATVSSGNFFPDEESRISSTWGGGDLLASIQGCLSIDVIRENGLMDNASDKGEMMRELIRDAGLDAVNEVRGLGLMVGVDFGSSELRKDVLNAAFKLGLLLLPCGDSTIRLLPPLDVREREVEMGVDLFVDAVEASTPN